MRTIVHLSDLHFGRINVAIIEPLIRAVNDIKPDVVAVSGDLTQRARSHQFKEARAFLNVLPKPQIIVPGNHDVPLHNVFTRFLQPLKKYRRFITADLTPSYADNEVVVLGVSTARSLTIKGGRINKEQVSWLKEQFCRAGPEVVKIVVTHHPFDLPEWHDASDLVGRARMAIQALAACGADLFISGHTHISYTGQTAKRYKVGGNTAIVVQAGTASSTRGRGESNSFNVIRIAYPEISIERQRWRPAEGVFVGEVTDRFRQANSGWIREET
jgi:3',5'-cyclic AMP phosphodiesterase CpdA